MVLKTFGCSLTYGSELKDHKLAWPYVLGEKLNLPVKNYGSPGASNDQIIESALLNCPKSNSSDLIIFLTTHWDRVYWPIDPTMPLWKAMHDENNRIIQGNTGYSSGNYRTLDFKDGEIKMPLLYSFMESKGNFNSKAYTHYLKDHCYKEQVMQRNDFLFNTCKELLNYRGHDVYVFHSYRSDNLSDDLSLYDVAKDSPRGPKGHWLEEGNKLWADYIYKHVT